MQAENLLSALTKQCQKQKLSRCLSLAYIRVRILQDFTFFAVTSVTASTLRPLFFLFNQDVSQQVKRHIVRRETTRHFFKTIRCLK